MMTEEKRDPRLFANALPFWASLSLVPVLIFAVYMGGVWAVSLTLYTLVVFSILDAYEGKYEINTDPNLGDEDLFWYRFITIIWFPIQFLSVFGTIYFIANLSNFNFWEIFAITFSLGVMSGAIGIVYAHELMHQKPKLERHMADLLMCFTLYGHFRSEHLKVHHTYVGTPKDPVTARYNEGFYRFFYRVLFECFVSAWNAEKKFLARKNLSSFHISNPFWKYAALEIMFLCIAFLIAGWLGVVLFVFQASVAVFYLELVNYMEHYGLTREHKGDGKYEHCQPHHSWNASHKWTNYLLINLQRHSDHHYKPDRRFPLLQTYNQDEAPQLPFGYAITGALALVPPLWRRRMNPRVRAWRAKFYPHIEDWSAYNKAQNPMPR